MTYFVVQDFGHGLDARKHILNLPAGSLYRARNVNINRGGEAESAKAFVSKGTFPSNDPPDPHAKSFGLLSAGGKLWTFGSGGYNTSDMPAGVQYQRLVHPGGGPMTDVIWATPIKGKPFVIASYTSGYGVFFNGALVTDWASVIAGITDYAGVAANIAAQINASAVYTAVVSGPTITITGRPNTPFTISATATNGGAVDDQTATVATTQNAAPGSGETLASGSITFSGVTGWYDPDSGHTFDVAFCSSVTINGVEQLALNLYGNNDVSAASAVASYCNSHVASPDYNAVASGISVTFTALAGTGATPNGYVIGTDSAYSSGGVMAGGVGVTSAIPQISTVTFGGTFEATDSYAVTLGGVVYTMAGVGGAGSSVAGQRPTVAITKNSKTYAIAGPDLFGSKIGDCTEWDTGTGTFVVDMSSQVAGAELLTALAIYQNNLAVFSRSTIQIRFVDPDPANDETLQVLQNIGTLASKSVVSFGDSDVFFLSDSGLRSLKTRTGTNSATLSDIGSPVDALLIAAIKAAGVNATKACAAMDPVDGRFLLQIGTTTYVFNFYPDAKVAGWTTYETGLAITDFAVLEQRLYARAGDTLYLLGGDNNDQYTPQQADIKLPFLSARQLATLKHFTALDVVCDGVFDVMMATDPLAPDTEEVIATVNGTTLGLGASPFGGEDCTAISLRFLGRSGKYGRLSSVAVHHEALKENAI